MRFPSANDLRRRKIERFRVIGKANLLAGGKNSYIATLVERHSRFLMLVKVPSKETEPVVAALSEHVLSTSGDAAPLALFWDRGLGDGQAQGVYGSDGLCRSTSAIRKVPGNAARTRIPICYCGNASREELI